MAETTSCTGAAGWRVRVPLLLVTSLLAAACASPSATAPPDTTEVGALGSPTPSPPTVETSPRSGLTVQSTEDCASLLPEIQRLLRNPEVTLTINVPSDCVFGRVAPLEERGTFVGLYFRDFSIAEWRTARTKNLTGRGLPFRLTDRPDLGAGAFQEVSRSSESSAKTSATAYVPGSSGYLTIAAEYADDEAAAAQLLSAVLDLLGL